MNLFNNAAQAMDGCGRLDIATGLVDETVKVTVRDSGPGFADDTLDRIWDPFFTTKAEGEGTGLGLSICREIVEEHGGTIEAGNAPEGGACFVMEFPLPTDHTSEQDTHATIQV